MRTNGHALLSARLDREWRALRRDPAAVARAAAWRLADERFDDLDELLALAGYRSLHTPARNDVLLRLVALARRDELAARIVLQRILPGLLAVARRHRRGGEGPFEELLGAAWLAIRSCRPERGYEQVAAHLVRDAAYRAFTAPTRRLSATEISVDPHTLDETPAVRHIGPCEELATLLEEARACGLDDRDLELVRDLVDVGSPSRLAALRKVTPRTVRNHRDRVAARLLRVARCCAA
jgi:hypothetical protein